MNSMKPHIREYIQEIRKGIMKQCYKRKKGTEKIKTFYLKKNKNHANLKQ